MLPNTVLEDISAEIGFNATMALAGWFGGNSIRIPIEASPNNEIAKVIGYLPFSRLVSAYAGQHIHIPKGEMATAIFRRRRQVRDLLRSGKSAQQTAETVGVTVTWIFAIRRDLELAGLLPTILKVPAGEDDPA